MEAQYEPSTFKTLKAKDGEIGLLQVVPDLDNCIVLRDEASGLFTYYPKARMNDLYARIQKRNCSFHEVINPGVPQRVRLDIDIDITNAHFKQIQVTSEACIARARMNVCSQCYEECSSSTCKCGGEPFPPPTPDDIKARFILDNIINAYKMIIPQNYVLCCSNRPGKYSYHLISTVYCDTSDGTNFIAKKIHEKIPDQLKQYNDIGVSSLGIHNLRMAGCIKPGKSETKKHIMKPLLSEERFDTRIRYPAQNDSTNPAEEWQFSLVTHINEFCTVMRMPNAPQRGVSSAVPTGDLPREVADEVEKDFPGVVYGGLSEKFHQFRRQAPGHCKICKRQHDKDGLYMWYYNEWYYIKCRRGGEKLQFYKYT